MKLFIYLFIIAVDSFKKTKYITQLEGEDVTLAGYESWGTEWRREEQIGQDSGVKLVDGIYRDDITE
jgi:hypothetical protein